MQFIFILLFLHSNLSVYDEKIKARENGSPRPQDTGYVSLAVGRRPRSVWWKEGSFVLGLR